MYFEALVSATYKFRMVIFSWLIDPFIIMQYPSLSLVIFLSLTSTLSDINCPYKFPFISVFTIYSLPYLQILHP